MKTFVPIALLSMSIVTQAYAEDVSITATLVPEDSIRMDFEDGSNQFVLMVRREGESEGQGALANADVTEYGWHDIDPPHGADPQGYLQFRTNEGDVANVKWTVRAVFFAGEERPRLVDYGFWELVSGTGQFERQTGVGTLTIKPAEGTARLFSLEGEIGPKP